MAQTRTLPFTEPQLVSAAKQVFSKSRPGQYVFQEVQGGLFAEHDWSHFGINLYERGVDKWEIRFGSAAGGTNVSLHETVRYGGLATVGFDPIDPVGSYNLFWARLDNTLGRRPDWVSCAQYKRQIADPKTPDNVIEDLCGPGSPP